MKTCNILIFSISVSTLPYNVQLVNIYLSTATFDEIEKDEKVTAETWGPDINIVLA